MSGEGTGSARAEILQRIRAAIAGTPRAGATTAGSESQAPALTVPREYRRSGDPAGSAAVVELLIDRLVDYRATVQHVGADGLEAAVQQALSTAASVVIPPALPAEVAAAVDTAMADRGGTVTVDSNQSAHELDGIDAVVTCARLAIALSGTIVLDGAGDQGRRALSLVPDLHLVVLRADQVVHTVPEGISALDPVAPLTMIAGPSATSDIELSRVEGVHGPRNLQVIIVTGAVSSPQTTRMEQPAFDLRP